MFEYEHRYKDGGTEGILPKSQYAIWKHKHQLVLVTRNDPHFRSRRPHSCTLKNRRDFAKVSVCWTDSFFCSHVLRSSSIRIGIALENRRSPASLCLQMIVCGVDLVLPKRTPRFCMVWWTENKRRL